MLGQQKQWATTKIIYTYTIYINHKFGKHICWITKN